MPQTRRAPRDAALVELQRLHAAILAARASRGASGEAPSPEADARRELTRRLQSDSYAPVDAELEPAGRSRRGVWLALAAAAIIAGTVAAMMLGRRPEVVTEAAPPAARPAAPDPATSPAATAEPPTATTVTAAPAGGAPVGGPGSAAPARPVQVTLDTIRPVWIRVTVDGSRALEREVLAGEHLSFGGDRAVVVRVGDAGGVRASMNGVDRGPLGKDGWPLTVPFTLDAPPPKD